MRLGNLAGGTCRVCGSDTMGADIGCSCKKLYHKATFIVLRKYDSESLQYNYGIEMEYWMDKFCKWYDEKLEKYQGNIQKMFRSEFNRQFFPSVYNQYKEKGFVSKKQLNIVTSKMFPMGWTEKEWKEIQSIKGSFLDNFKRCHDAELIEVTRNLWKQKKTV